MWSKIASLCVTKNFLGQLNDHITTDLVIWSWSWIFAGGYHVTQQNSLNEKVFKMYIYVMQQFTHVYLLGWPDIFRTQPESFKSSMLMCPPFQEQLERAQELQDCALEAQAYGNLGIAKLNMGHYEDAIGYLEQVRFKKYFILSHQKLRLFVPKHPVSCSNHFN